MKMMMVVIPPQQRPSDPNHHGFDDHDDHDDGDGDDHGDHKYGNEKDRNNQTNEDLRLTTCVFASKDSMNALQTESLLR